MRPFSQNHISYRMIESWLQTLDANLPEGPISSVKVQNETFLAIFKQFVLSNKTSYFVWLSMYVGQLILPQRI